MTDDEKESIPESLASKVKLPAQVAAENGGKSEQIKEDINMMNKEVERIKRQNEEKAKGRSKEEQQRIEEESDMERRKKYMKLRVMEILVHKFNEIRLEQTRIRFDRISPQLLRYFTLEEDVDGNEIPRTISFREIMRIYPNAKTITFVNRHLDHEGHNTSCFNELVITSLRHETQRKRENDESKECPLKKVVFTYYDYEGDIFDTNEKLKNTENDAKMKRYFDAQWLNMCVIAGWKVKHHKIGSGYKIRIERK